jgi:ATP-dependent RNA helicase UAP56/SUB2
MHTASFKDFQLRIELETAVENHGFEHPSEVQCQCIPQALNGRDIICQAKSGMGKTAVFVLTILHTLRPEKCQCQAIILTHTRELAVQITDEFKRFSQELPVLVDYFLGGEPLNMQVEKLNLNVPNITVGSPGRMFRLVELNYLKLDRIEFFVLDECDRMLLNTDMRIQVQGTFRKTPHHKQVMMFSATLPENIRPVCRRLTKNPMEIYVDDQAKLTLHGLLQFYVNLPEEAQKNRKLLDLLDGIDFNQVIIFVKSQDRAEQLAKILKTNEFPTVVIHGRMKQKERVRRFQLFKSYGKRILVTTDLMGRGIDINKVNVVINYDLPSLEKSDDEHEMYNRAVDQYLHRVGRAGRFGTKGLGITFVSSPEDATLLNKVQERFLVNVRELPELIHPSLYKDISRGET